MVLVYSTRIPVYFKARTDDIRGGELRLSSFKLAVKLCHALQLLILLAIAKPIITATAPNTAITPPMNHQLIDSAGGGSGAGGGGVGGGAGEGEGEGEGEGGAAFTINTPVRLFTSTV